MIIEKILDMMFAGTDLIISMLPTPIVEVLSGFSVPDIVRHGVCFFPEDIILATVTAFIGWKTVFLTWAVVEWVYKKIPGIN